MQSSDMRSKTNREEIEIEEEGLSSLVGNEKRDDDGEKAADGERINANTLQNKSSNHAAYCGDTRTARCRDCIMLQYSSRGIYRWIDRSYYNITARVDGIPSW